MQHAWLVPSLSVYLYVYHSLLNMRDYIPSRNNIIVHVSPQLCSPAPYEIEGQRQWSKRRHDWRQSTSNANTALPLPQSMKEWAALSVG